MNTPSMSGSGSPSAMTGAEYKKHFEELLPALLAQAGAGLGVEKLREESCLAPEIEDQQAETNWVGKVTGPVADTASANSALDRVAGWLDAEGWEKQNEVSYPPEEGGEVRSMVYSKDSVGLTATYRRAAAPMVEILVSTPCMDNPPEHRMQRSEQDPDYGLSSQYYEDGAS